MGRDQMDYAKMVEDALRDVVRKALIHVSEKGLPGDHYFYITFRTDQPGVEMADYLRERYPQEMTIVLQHQFWGLEIEAEAFAVLLSFNKVHERLYIPFRTLVGFSDPTSQFGLQFTVADTEEAAAGRTGPPAALSSVPMAGLPAPDRPADGPAGSADDDADAATGKPRPAATAGDDAGAAAEGGDPAEPQDNVVTLDAFRKKQGTKD